MSTTGEDRPTRVDDSQLIRAAQQGDTAAFETLVHQYDQAILRLTIHLAGSQKDGQDLYQAAFLRAYVNLPRFRFECSFYTWIYQIATNLCLDHLRKQRSRNCELSTTSSQTGEKPELLDSIADQSAGTGASAERNLTSLMPPERIARALSNLLPCERMVLELKHYHGLQLRTVAGILKTTEATVQKALFCATRKLRLWLA